MQVKGSVWYAALIAMAWVPNYHKTEHSLHSWLCRFDFPQEVVGYRSEFIKVDGSGDILDERKNTGEHPSGVAFIEVTDKRESSLVVGHKFAHIRNHERINTTIIEQIPVFRANTDSKMILRSKQVTNTSQIIGSCPWDSCSAALTLQYWQKKNPNPPN